MRVTPLPVLFSIPIFADAIEKAESVQEVLSGGFVRVFYAEIIDNEGDSKHLGSVLPEAWWDGDMGVAMGDKEFDATVIRKAATACGRPYMPLWILTYVYPLWISGARLYSIMMDLGMVAVGEQ